MLYLARHGETAWNVSRRFQGAQDSELTGRGVKQADAIGRLLASLLSSRSPTTCYVSPLGRARRTAELIGRHVLLAQVVEPRIAEVTLGVWDGLSRYEIEMEFPGALAGATALDWYFRSPNGESFEAVSNRVSAWLAEVETPAIVVSHGLLGRIIRGIYLGLPAPDMLALPVPQDAVYRLSEGGAEFLAASAT